MSCFICQKHPIVWARCYRGNASYGATPTSLAYTKLPGTISWALEADITEADEVLTSDTNGLLVKACGDTVSYSLNVESALCTADWLYNILLQGVSAAASRNPGLTNQLQLFATWDPAVTDVEVEAGGITFDIDPDQVGDESGVVRGVFMTGTVTPGGFGVDGGNSTAPVTTEWSVNLTDVVFPVLGGPALDC